MLYIKRLIAKHNKFTLFNSFCLVIVAKSSKHSNTSANLSNDSRVICPVYSNLFKTIFETLESEVAKQCNKYVLAMSDWSHLDYKKHSSKKELTYENRKDTCMKIGYDFQTTLVVRYFFYSNIPSVTYTLCYWRHSIFMHII